MDPNPHDDNAETYLYIGVNPSDHSKDIIATFTGSSCIPISWYFLFSPESAVSRQEEFPNSWADLVDKKKEDFKEIPLENIENYLNESVAFRTTLPEAKARLADFKEVFQSIPYIWSYFKVINIIDQQLESFISDLESNPQITPAIRHSPHPDAPRSQVKIKDKSQELPEDNSADDLAEFDNPFAELESIGQPSQEENDDTTMMDADLMSALQAAAVLDKLESETFDEDQEKVEEEEFDTDFLPIVVQFDKIVTNGAGQNIAKVLVLMERLMHHARREGRMTRIMQDYLQEIFREAIVSWRITGQLAEDFVQGDPSVLAEIMIGTPSPFVIIKETFDLEYWTAGTLQPGDERLMYTLSMLPSEQIHKAIRDGSLVELSESIGGLLVTTQGILPPKLSLDLLKLPPVNSNIWGFRVLVQDVNKEYKAATILCTDPGTSWEDDFKEKVKLPGVLEDWNIEYSARFDEFSDMDNYRIIFEGAKDIDETFQGFSRWVRRHHILYRTKFGVKGTILHLKQILADTQDKQMGQLIFDILTKLTELGIGEAMDVLSDPIIVRKLPWLYS